MAANQVVIAVLTVDDVGALLAQHHVVTGASIDQVVASTGSSGEVDRVELEFAALLQARPGRVERRVVSHADLALIAKDQVIASAAVDRVGPSTTDQNIVAVAAGQRVVTAVDEANAVDAAEHERVRRVIGVGLVAHQRSQLDVVADHDVQPQPAGQDVAAFATDHDVVAAAGDDGVVAAGCPVGRRDAVDVTGVVVVAHVIDVTEVADDDVLAVGQRRGLADVGGDDVIANAAEDDVAAGAGADDVVAAHRRGDGFDATEPDRMVVQRCGHRRHTCRAGRCGDATVVAEDDVVGALTRVDGVVAGAADDDVAAAQRGDGVVAAAQIGRGALDQVDVGGVRIGARRAHWRTFQAHVVNPAVVAEDQVVATAQAQDVACKAADDHIVAAAGGDGIDTAVVEHAALDQPKSHRHAAELRRVGDRSCDATAVADDQVLAVAGVDRVTETPTDDDVVAAVGGDGVGATVGGGRGALDQVNVATVAVGHREVDHAVVTEDDVVIGPGVDGVATTAAQDAVVARAAQEVVARAIAKLDAGDSGDKADVGQPQRAGRLVDRAMVAKDDVVAAAAVDQVNAGQQQVTVECAGAVDGGHRQQTRHHRRVAGIFADVEGQVEARISMKMIVAAQAEDRVVARATGDVVAEGAAGEAVVAGAAVDRDAAAGTRRIDHVVAGVGEVHGVAGVDAQVGSCVVAAAVLCGVAINHQRRCGPATAGNADGVAAHHASHRAAGQHSVAAAMHHGDDLVAGTRRARAGGADVECVVALAQQHFGDLDVVVGDAAQEGDQMAAVLRLADVDAQGAARAGRIWTHAQA